MSRRKDFKEMTEEEKREFFYRKNYGYNRPKRLPKDEQSRWCDWDHKDFFETMTYLEVLYQSPTWKWLENNHLIIVDETPQAVKVQAKGYKTLHQWIPKFLLEYKSNKKEK